MITNERQLQISRARIERFEASLDAIEGGSLAGSDLDPLLQEAQRDAIAGQLREMRKEVADYEALRSGEIAEFDLGGLAEIPVLLIRTRIAAGLTQRDLAERVGIKEQQIQRYEANRYEGASFARIVEIGDAIGLKIASHVAILQSGSIDTLLARLALFGVSETFLRKRLAPRLGLGKQAVAQLLDRVKAIYGWEPRHLEANVAAPIEVGAATARFKMPRGRDERAAGAYTAYAYYLATICADAMSGKPRQAVPTGWKDFRSALLERYETLDLGTTLSFAWDLGVVILPLRDPGGFHGACWRISGVNVIVLKQTSSYPARWLFDLIHELFHAGQDPEASEFSWVEDSEFSEDRRTSPEEQHAMWFAGQVGLNGRAEELAALAMKQANNGFLPKLKQSVPQVAATEGVSTGYLANYLAFRLSLQGENWWGAATNLQERGRDPYQIARDIFFDRFDFGSLSADEVEMIGLALDDEAPDG